MIRRRSVLRTLGGAAGAGLAAGLAGCGGDDTDVTETEDPQVQAAREAYDEAINALVGNRETLDDWAEGRPGRDQQDIVELRDGVDRARESLDEAEPNAPDDLAAQIDHARDVAAFQAALVDFYELTIEFEEARADARAFGDAEQHERAVEQYGEAKDVLEEARSQLEDVEAAHERIDNEAFEEPDLDYRGEYTRYVEVEGKGSVDAQELMIDGQREVHSMFVELNAGFDRYENEEFVVAREQFVAGEDARARAEEAFVAVQEHEFAWPDLRQRSIQMRGIVEDLAEAFELFIDATHEAEAGNPREANELAQEGFFVLEKAFE